MKIEHGRHITAAQLLRPFRKKLCSYRHLVFQKNCKNLKLKKKDRYKDVRKSKRKRKKKINKLDLLCSKLHFLFKLF